MGVWRLRVVSWSMAAELLAFSSRQFALAIKHGLLFRPLHIVFPS